MDIEIDQNNTATLIDKNGDTHVFNNGKEILEFTENVGMYALHEMFYEDQIDFLIKNGRC